MCDLKMLRTRIVPIPKKIELTQGTPLKLTVDSKFCIHAPIAEFGPLVGANEKLRKFLQTNCGDDCYAQDGIRIHLSLGERPEEVQDIPGGYRLTVSGDGVEIVGFDPVGVLYGVVSLTQVLVW